MMKLKFILLIPLIGLIGCTKSNTTRLDSNNYKSDKERIEVLKAEINAPSEFQDAEFELFNVNGFTNSRSSSVPGASSWDYKFAIKVKKPDSDKWIKGMNKKEPNDHDLEWTKLIIAKRPLNWETKSIPELYNREGNKVNLVLYREEGIIFKRVINL